MTMQDISDRVLTKHEILTALREPFPPEKIKTKPGGRNLSYVEGHEVLERLDHATNGWSDEVTWRQIVKLPAKRTDRDTGEVHQYLQEVLMVEVRLTIPELGTRSGAGVQEIQEGSGADVMKGAWTDAIKVAASKFGVARHLYFGDTSFSDSGYSRNDDTPPWQEQNQGYSQNQGAGSGMKYPPSDKQVNFFKSLTEELHIDRNAVAQQIANYPLERLNSTGYRKVIDFLQKVKTGELEWHGPRADYSSGQNQSPSQSAGSVTQHASNQGQNQGDHLPGQTNHDATMANWRKQIENATDEDTLTRIAAAMNEFGLMSEEVSGWMDKRADELGVLPY